MNVRGCFKVSPVFISQYPFAAVVDQKIALGNFLIEKVEKDKKILYNERKKGDNYGTAFY